MLAERGYRFILQAVRGTDGSGGSQSFFAERDDSRATADWITTQPWWNGHLGTYGASYMGFTQWALASTAPAYLDAMVISLSSRRSSWYLGGALALELMINWDLSALAFLHPERGGFAQDITPQGIEHQQQMLTTAYQHLPLGDALVHVAGENHPLYEQQLAHPSADDPHWAPIRFQQLLDQWTVPTLLVDSWFDAPLPGVCDDYVALRAGGAPVAMRIGGGGHLDGGGEGALDAALAWFDRHLAGDQSVDVGAPVSVHVPGRRRAMARPRRLAPAAVRPDALVPARRRSPHDGPSDRGLTTGRVPVRPGRSHARAGRHRPDDRRHRRQRPARGSGRRALLHQRRAGCTGGVARTGRGGARRVVDARSH